MTVYDEVQRVVLTAPRGDCVAHVLLTFKDASRGQNFFKQLWHHQSVSFGHPERGSAAEVSLGLSFRGLQALGVPLPYLASFRRVSPAFCEGAPHRAASRLGDVGESAAEFWNTAFLAEVAHAVLSVHAPDWRALARALRPLQQAAKRARVVWRDLVVGARLGAPSSAKQAQPREAWVHFGYRDGLSNVRVRGWHRPQCDAQRLHEPGELILGYPNDHGSNPGQLPGAPRRVREFFCHGSFGILRQIEQDVSSFDEQVKMWAEQVALQRFTPGKGKDYTDYVKAKLCGRWPDGRLFDECGNRPDEKTPVEADFSHAGDPQGVRCPLGAHIRRMNPREESGTAGVVHARSRPLLRRGMPYGGWDDKQRGLLGWFFCTSIEDQFEHLLGQWAERAPLGVQVQGKDPLIGQHDSNAPAFEIALLNYSPHQLKGWRPFCTTRGTVYAFYPSRHALRRLADADYDLKDDPQDDAVIEDEV